MCGWLKNLWRILWVRMKVVGTLAGQGMCCVTEVMVEGRRAISGSWSTENRHPKYTWSVVTGAELVISAAGRRQDPFLQSSGDLRVVYCCYLMIANVILFRDKPTFLDYFSYFMKFLLRSIHGQFRDTDQMKNLVPQFWIKLSVRFLTNYIKVSTKFTCISWQLES